MDMKLWWALKSPSNAQMELFRDVTLAPKVAIMSISVMAMKLCRVLKSEENAQMEPPKHATLVP